MKAVGFYRSLPIADENSLVDIELPMPAPSGHDILVEVKAIAVNPIDTKVRLKQSPNANDSVAKVLGWDVAGVVKAVGVDVTLFEPGDEVWYAGDVTRPGANSEFHLVDERIAAKKPQSLTFEEAAALPLTGITAWELLFDRLNVGRDEKCVLLITGAAGGVGSVLVQLARQLTQLTVIGTAARPESKQWVLDHGAHHVISHGQEFKSQLQTLDVAGVDYAISLTHTDDHAKALYDVLKPQSKFALIDDPRELDFTLFKPKSISIHWEMMFTRSMFKTRDMEKQHEILSHLAKLVDEGKIRSTLATHLGKINAANLRQAHALLESGTARGKIVLSGF